MGGKYANYWSKKNRERACDNGAGVMTYRYLKKCDACTSTCLHKFLFSPSLKKKGTTWQAVSWYHCLRIPGFLVCCRMRRKKLLARRWRKGVGIALHRVPGASVGDFREGGMEWS